jgi:hypothetical protein
MTYCARCELYVKCKRGGDKNQVPFYCEYHNRPRRYAWREAPIVINYACASRRAHLCLSEPLDTLSICKKIKKKKIATICGGYV